jgi:hypothetical protein
VGYVVVVDKAVAEAGDVSGEVGKRARVRLDNLDRLRLDRLPVERVARVGATLLLRGVVPVLNL